MKHFNIDYVMTCETVAIIAIVIFDRVTRIIDTGYS